MGGKRQPKAPKPDAKASLAALVGAGVDLKAIERVVKSRNSNWPLSVTGPLVKEQARQVMVQQCAGIVGDALAFRDVDPDGPVPPAWVEQYGQEEAEKRFRLARAAWAASSHAPYGLQLAKDIVTADMRAAAKEGPAQRPLAIAVQMNVTVNNFPEREVEG